MADCRTFDETARQVIALRYAAARMSIPPSPQPQCRPLPPLERLRQVFDYDPETGVLMNRVSRGSLKAGAIAGLKHPDRFGGYVICYVDGAPYRAHRIAFKMMTGRDPRGHIDHIDGRRANNAWANLREATPLENARNRHTARGVVPVVGVSRCCKSGRYLADIGAGGKVWHLGSYDALSDAIAARKYAEKVLFDLPGGRG